jgi:hypothetical protein
MVMVAVVMMVTAFVLGFFYTSTCEDSARFFSFFRRLHRDSA